MTDRDEDDHQPPRPGGLVPSMPDPRQLAVIDLAAAGLTLAWLIVAAVFFFAGDGSADGGRPLSALVAALAVLMPVAFIWLVAASLRTFRRIREDAARMQQEIDALRRGATAAPLRQPPVAAAMAPAQLRSPQAPAPLRREPRATRNVPPQDQQALAFAETAAPDPLPPEDFIVALNFPDSPDDHDGIRALRRALEDPAAAKLIRSAQDVLNLLGTDGIYMDDLVPGETPSGALWRRFAEGTRGQSIAALGAVEEPNVLAATATRMRSDPVFRDAAHHFLRQFDRNLSDFARTMPDEALAIAGQTRTARAFMLLGRVAGTFD